MKLTTLFRLRKPDGMDPVNIEDFNDNFDVIDEELGKRLESTGAASDMTVAFEQASARTNLKTGEKISVSFGKIMKWFADLKTVAFSGSYNDLTSKPTIPSGAAASQAVANNCTTTAAGSVLDARQGKVLMDKANQLSSETARINVYVGSDGKLHFVNKAGADSVLPFNSGKTSYSVHFWMYDDGDGSSSSFVIPTDTSRIHINSFSSSNVGHTPNGICKITDGNTGGQAFYREGGFSNVDVNLDPSHQYTIEIRSGGGYYHTVDFNATGYFKS